MVMLTDQDCHDLITINRLDEILTSACNDQVVKMAAITRSTMRRSEAYTIIREDVIQQVRLDRIKQAQDEESWIANLKLYLDGDVTELGATETKYSAVIVPGYVVDEGGLLYYLPAIGNIFR